MTASNIAVNPGRGQGAYGLRLDGLDTPLLVSPVPDSWPCVGVALDHETLPPHRSSYSGCAIDLSFGTGWGISLRREASTITFQVPPRASLDDLVHPYLAAAAMHFAGWLGYSTFHGGAFVQHGRAFAVFAHKNGGKSTTLAALAASGISIIADDLLVVDKSAGALSGPRSIDLRPEAVGDHVVEPVRVDERHRLRLPPIEPTHPLAGVFVLGWADRFSMERLTPSERVVELTRHCPPDVARTSVVLELSRLPLWRVNRLRDLSCLDDVCDRILQTALE
ncbi:MAG TPA: hypothetical protein VM053_06475 [Gemmatimonadaceae bacterium]|nr:hypothetical protein [Gemmatimonadaceae bacterium]